MIVNTFRHSGLLGVIAVSLVTPVCIASLTHVFPVQALDAGDCSDLDNPLNIGSSAMLTLSTENDPDHVEGTFYTLIAKCNFSANQGDVINFTYDESWNNFDVWVTDYYGNKVASYVMSDNDHQFVAGPMPATDKYVLNVYDKFAENSDDEYVNIDTSLMSTASPSGETTGTNSDDTTTVHSTDNGSSPILPIIILVGVVGIAFGVTRLHRPRPALATTGLPLSSTASTLTDHVNNDAEVVGSIDNTTDLPVSVVNPRLGVSVPPNETASTDDDTPGSTDTNTNPWFRG